MDHNTEAACKCHVKNLKEELIAALEEASLTVEDVIWAGSKDFYIDPEKFWELIDVEYDAGFGPCTVANDLVVMCDGGWFWREAWDGLEWWHYEPLPKKPTRTENIESVVITDQECVDEYGLTLAEINGINVEQE